MSDSIRKIRVELAAETSSFQKGFSAASGAVSSLSKDFGGLQKALTAGFGALSGVAAPIAAGFVAMGAAIAVATKRTIDYASSLYQFVRLGEDLGMHGFTLDMLFDF